MDSPVQHEKAPTQGQATDVGYKHPINHTVRAVELLIVCGQPLQSQTRSKSGIVASNKLPGMLDAKCAPEMLLAL